VLELDVEDFVFYVDTANEFFQAEADAMK